MPTSRTLPRPDEAPPPEPASPRLHISATQLIASALAAVTATIAASFLGVSGTVIGAAVASVVTVLGNAVYGHSLRQTGNRVRTIVPAGVRWAPVASDGRSAGPDGRSAGSGPATPRRRERKKSTSPRVLAAACVGMFALVLVLVTTVELVAGQPLSDLLRGRSGSGTSLLGGDPEPRSQPGPTPSTPRPSSTVIRPAHVVPGTPTVTVTAPPSTTTVTPSPTTQPATPTPDATSSPAASTDPPTPTGTPTP